MDSARTLRSRVAGASNTPSSRPAQLGRPRATVAGDWVGMPRPRRRWWKPGGREPTLSTGAPPRHGRGGVGSRRLPPSLARGGMASGGGGGGLDGSIGDWDQFSANEKKFGVKASFDKNLYTTKLDVSSIDASRRAEAERIAREIDSTSSTNMHVAEERNQAIAGDYDEEDRYSGVLTKDLKARQILSQILRKLTLPLNLPRHEVSSHSNSTTNKLIFNSHSKC